MKPKISRDSKFQRNKIFAKFGISAYLVSFSHTLEIMVDTVCKNVCSGQEEIRVRCWVHNQVLTKEIDE